MEEVRRFKFTLGEARSKDGVVRVIGRASDTNLKRQARRDNLLFDERSLSKNHAILGLKLLDPLEPNTHIIDQFRIYIKDLGSTYGIVDLNSEESDPFVIDLKNGERFGLVALDEPISMYQNRAAKLKFQVNLQYSDPRKGIFECIVKDVSFDDSPMVSRPPTYDKEHSSSSSSSSDWNFSEGFIATKEKSLGISAKSTDGFASDSSRKEESYSIVDLLTTCDDSEEWDVLESEESDENLDVNPGELLRSSQKNFTARNRYLIINYEPKVSDDSQEKNKSVAVTKTLIVSAMIGFVVGFLGTVVLLVGLALKEMD